MEHLKHISQKPQMRPFGADFSFKNSIKVFSSISYTKMYYKQGYL